MRASLRFFRKRVSPLEAELMAARPEPSAHLTDSIVRALRPSPQRPRLRLAYAGALTAAMVAVLAATGGFAYAASAIHLTSPKAAHVGVTSAACSQYAKKPIVDKIKPRAGKVGTKVTVIGSRFVGISRITKVVFAGGRRAHYRVESYSKLWTKVPSGARTGGITVFNCAGHATSPTFKVK